MGSGSSQAAFLVVQTGQTRGFNFGCLGVEFGLNNAALNSFEGRLQRICRLLDKLPSA
jgi:hypothetical protein